MASSALSLNAMLYISADNFVPSTTTAQTAHFVILSIHVYHAELTTRCDDWRRAQRDFLTTEFGTKPQREAVLFQLRLQLFLIKF